VRSLANCCAISRLAICKHLVELHGGSISAESVVPGRGAMIKVKLRTIASKSEPNAAQPAQRAFSLGGF
jgi:hypothetical protein